MKLLLSQNSEKEIFENNIFNIITFVVAITCIISFIINLCIDNYFLLDLIIGIFGITFSIFFYLSFFRKITKPLIFPFQILVALSLTISWFYFQGIEGSIPLFFFPAIFLLIYSNQEKKYWHIFIGYVALAIILVVIHFLYPEWTIPYADKNSRILDISFSFILTLFMLGYATIALKKNFDLERSRTEQKKRELEISEGRFRDIAMSSGDWIWEVDANGFYTFCSEKVEELLGYTPNEMIGKTPFDFMPEDEVEKVREKFLQLINERRAFKNLENRNLTKAGKCIWILTNGVPVMDNQGNLIGYRGTDTDVTERVQMENRIRKMNEVQAALHNPGTLNEKLKLITDGVVDIFDADFARIWLMCPGDRCNSGCIHAEVTEGPHVCLSRVRCFHLLASSGRYTHLDGMVHRRVPFGCYKIGLIASGKESSFLTNEVTTDPRVHNHEWAKTLGLVSFAGYQLRPSHGGTIGVMALFSKHHISSEEDALLKSFSNLIVSVIQTTQAEDALRESEYFFKESQHAAFIGSYKADFITGLWESSEVLDQIFGIDESYNRNVQGGWLDIIYLDDREIMNRYLTIEVILNRKPFNKEYRIVRKSDGEIRWVLGLGKLDFDAEGNVISLIGTIQDVTERKKAEENLVQLNLQLNEINATKDKFFSIIAHDLRNPFNAIIGFSNILVEQMQAKEYEGVEEYAGIIQNSSQRAMDLLMNLLEWARAQTGKIEFNPETVEIVSLIDKVAELLNDTAKQKSITISRKNSFNLPVFADKAMISTILRNLISNAIKFTNPGGSIVISAEQKQDEVMITVSDNGTGIKKESIDKLFRIEESTSTTGTQNEKGTGLGLLLCKEFILKHKGRIWVESEWGKGSEFHFTLPNRQ